MIVTARVNGSEVKTAVLLGGTRPFVILPGLSPRSILRSAPAVECMYRNKAKDMRLYLVDRREEVPDDYSIEGIADDTAAALYALGVRNAAVFGASQGGMIAQALAAKYPELVSALVLGSTTSKTNPTVLKVIGHWADLAEAGEGDRLAHEMTGNICSETMLARFGDVLAAGAKDLTEAELRRFAILARTCLNFDAEPYLKNITCPVLVLGSKGDRVMTPEASIRLAELTKAELYLYGPEFGHIVYDEASDYIDRMMLFFEHVFDIVGKQS